ncbi:hypothetical protein [Desulfopila aestuarii]|uniref:Uncharacterized protein n=1 Tax=Desulfopila aestuarii DSM 18488 TaxID=1121416 RepID=A0A1M7YMM8_9BACT|nr:hypothetical protein [Desulfopila aestuarii]SHO53921.1 hypothetical protein SAMN02745220_05364 [Desulfopila aestuarii DSM 18488]
MSILHSFQYISHKKQKIYLTVLTVSLSLAAFSVLWSRAAELRPYELPSQKRPYYQQQYQQGYESSPPETAYRNFDYSEYARRVSGLSPQERSKLSQGLQQRMKDAMNKNNYIEVRHYARLLEIVNGTK